PRWRFPLGPGLGRRRVETAVGLRHRLERHRLGNGLRALTAERPEQAGRRVRRRQQEAAPHQNCTFIPSCTCREVPTVVVIEPALAGVFPVESNTVVAGSPKFGWLRTLNASPRSCSFILRTVKFLKTPASQLA